MTCLAKFTVRVLASSGSLAPTWSRRGRRIGSLGLGAMLGAGLLLAGCQTEPGLRSSVSWAPMESPRDSAENPRFSKEDLAGLMDKGNGALKAGKLDEALYHYAHALDVAPDHVPALLEIGAIHRVKGNDTLAEAAYRLAIKSAPRNAEALEGLGLVKLAVRDDAAARQVLTAAVAADPTRWQAQEGLGLIADRAGQYAEAQLRYGQALRIQPEQPRLLTNRGQSRYHAGDWSGALGDYDAALRVDPGYAPAWYNKGLVLARQGQERAALEAFRRVMDEADAYNDLGYIYMTQGDIDRAHELFEKAIFVSPTYHELANENLRRLRNGDYRLFESKLP